MQHKVVQNVHTGTLHIQYLQTGICLPVFYGYGCPKYDQKLLKMEIL